MPGRKSVPDKTSVAPRRVRYQVAMSLDGYIAGPTGEADWITMDPAIDFAAHFAQFDAFLVGRRTFEGLVTAGMATLPGEVFVFSRTLRGADHPTVRIIDADEEATIAELRRRPGKDIWLFGGGVLFRESAE